MRKQLIVTLAILVCLSIFMVGCGNGNGNGNGNGDEEIILYDFDLSEYVEVGSLRGLEILAAHMPRTEATDEEIEAELQRMLEALSIPVLIGEVMMGDNANIDYIGTRDGVAFEGGTAFGQYLGIGSGRFIPGFEEQLIGVAIGDTVVIDVTFPDPYFPNPDLAGVVVQFEVTINHVAPRVTPELTDEIAQDFFGADSAEGLREELRAEIDDWFAENYTRTLHGILWETILDNATVLEYPMREVNAAFTQRRSEEEAGVAEMGMTWEQLLDQLGMTDSEANEILLEQARQEVKMNMVLLATVKQEGIELTDEDIDAGIIKLLSEVDIESEEEFREITGQGFIEFHGRQTTERMILFRKIMEIAIETMVIIE